MAAYNARTIDRRTAVAIWLWLMALIGVVGCTSAETPVPVSAPLAEGPALVMFYTDG